MNSVFLALVHQTTTEKDEKTICARTKRAHFDLFFSMELTVYSFIDNYTR